MGTSIGQYGDNGASLILNAGLRDIEMAQAEVAFQASSGVNSETFAGMDPTSRNAVITITPKITEIESDKTNLHAAKARLTVTEGALKNIAGLAQNMAASILDISRTSAEPTNITDAAIEAKSAIQNIGSYLNTSTGDSYVFSGRNYKHPPIPHPHKIADSPLASDIANYMQHAVDNNVDPGKAFQQATKFFDLELNNHNNKGIFNSFLYASPSKASDPNGNAQANLDLAENSRNIINSGSGDDFSYGIVATQSQGTTPSLSDQITPNRMPKASTGSPIKDLFRDLMMIQGMKNSSPNGSQYMKFMHSMHESLVRTSNSIINMESAVGYKQDAIDQRQDNLNLTETALQVQLSKARDVDPAQLAVKSQGLQLSLKASFMLISQMRNMSLANYI